MRHPLLNVDRRMDYIARELALLQVPGMKSSTCRASTRQDAVGPRICPAQYSATIPVNNHRQSALYSLSCSALLGRPT